MKYPPRLAICLALFLGARAASAHQASWETDATGKLSLTQAGFYNWQEGGVSSLALSAGVNGNAERTRGRWHLRNSIRLGYGIVKQDSIALRKAEDLIHVRSAVSHQGNGFFARFQPTLGFDFRSQFAPGFEYDRQQADSTGAALRVSGFLAPATLTETVGVTYRPAAYVELRVGLAAKETLVTMTSLRERYGVDRSKPARLEAGLAGLFVFSKEIANNVRLQSSLSVFASFNQVDKPDMLSETLITMKVNKWLHVDFEYVALLDQDVAHALQMKEVFSLGISFILL